jgi:hypothetical protein
MNESIAAVSFEGVAACIGIDWADQKHEVALRSATEPNKVEHRSIYRAGQFIGLKSVSATRHWCCSEFQRPLHWFRRNVHFVRIRVWFFFNEAASGAELSYESRHRLRL